MVDKRPIDVNVLLIIDSRTVYKKYSGTDDQEKSEEFRKHITNIY